tara:strand:- start:545 stop:775 length:231 start_codon:yes stop_codon:yes gene_type:complete
MRKKRGEALQPRPSFAIFTSDDLGQASTVSQERYPNLAVALWCFTPASWLITSVIASVALMAMKQVIQQALDRPLM